MLCSVRMPSEDQKPATLASLRLRSRPSRGRVPRDSAPMQPGLLFDLPADPAAPDQWRPATSGRDIDTPLPAPERRVWSVRSLVTHLRQHVEAGYADLWVEGELSNCRAAPSGHLYLTLKDGESQLPVVLFRREALLLRFRPADGMAVLVRGRLSVYEPRGQMQLIADTLEPRGAGALQVAFEQRKQRLAAEGLFDSARKRPLPAFPRSIGIITSPNGAVLRDIATIIRRRHRPLDMLVYPAVMQGGSCATTVIRAIAWFNRNPHEVDLIVLARGGGSAEDLAGFNDEALARAIAGSGLPVVSAIGHETDFTIADLAADLRAPTPSAAAELVTAALHRVEERLDRLEGALDRSAQFHLLRARARFNRLSAGGMLVRLQDALNRRSQRVDDLHGRVGAAFRKAQSRRRARLDALNTRLLRQGPAVRLAVGARRLETSRGCLNRLQTQLVAGRRQQLDRAISRLEALSPVAVLARGYALVYAEDGTLIQSASALTPGQPIRARLGTGSLLANVTEIKIP